MRYRHVLSRRTLLRGAGSVAIALPFLDEMRARSVYAAEPEPPFRAFNVFFGLGVPKEIQAEGFTGPLAPLAPLADKLALVRGVNLYEGDGPDNNHFDGSGSVFTAVKPTSDSRAGGPSIDQVVLADKYPQGPGTLVTTLMMGSFFRRWRNSTNLALTRFVHSWREDGTPVDLPLETPAALFQRIFGSIPGNGPDGVKAQHYERSILDSVLDQYRHYTSPASGLGTSSRSRISNHLDKIREYEKRLFPEALTCTIADDPGELVLVDITGDNAKPIVTDQDKDGGGGGPEVMADAWASYWQVMADLYALAIQCDVTRFGMVTFQSAGERIHLRGPWDYHGETIMFNDIDDPAGAAGIHEYWHNYSASGENTTMRWHIHFTMSQLAYFLQALDNPQYVDENGKTILDNALVTISTELGDGAPHNLESVFHAVTGVNDRVRTGQLYDVNASATDLYNTLLGALGIGRTMGTPEAFEGTVDSILL